MYISSKFPGDAGPAGLGTILWESLVWRKDSQAG